MRAVLVAASLALSGICAAVHADLPGKPASVTRPAPKFGAMERVVSGNPLFVLFKPASWTLQQSAQGGKLQISIASPDRRSVVQVEFEDNRTHPVGSEPLMRHRLRDFRTRYPDIKVVASSLCNDALPSCAEASVEFTADGVANAGRYFFHADDKVTTIRSYRAPATRLPWERALLLDILTNIHVRELQPLAVRYVRQQASDHSASIELPSNWTFLGRKGSLLAAAPQGSAGFVFTSFSVMQQSYGVPVQPGVIIAPYKPPHAFIRDIFAQFRNRQTRVLASQPDRATAAQCPSQIGRPCEAADVQISWVSPEGVPCIGGFKVLNAAPNLAGQWFSIIAGIWGPADDLIRYVPVLEHVAGSFAINDAYAKRYIEQGMAQVRAMEQRTRQAIQGLYSAIEQNQRDYETRSARQDASNARRDDYMRGNSYWISDLEGGKVYQTDPWGTRDTSSGTRYDGPDYNYIHFEGQNPVHPSENMREASSYEIQQMNR